MLQRDGARLALAPGRGGAIHEFKWRGRDVLRPTPLGLGDDPLDTSCFPMVPYVNRVAQGRFEFAGRAVWFRRLERGSGVALAGSHGHVDGARVPLFACVYPEESGVLLC